MFWTPAEVPCSIGNCRWAKGPQDFCGAQPIQLHFPGIQIWQVSAPRTYLAALATGLGPMVPCKQVAETIHGSFTSVLHLIEFQQGSRLLSLDIWHRLPCFRRVQISAFRIPVCALFFLPAVDFQLNASSVLSSCRRFAPTGLQSCFCWNQSTDKDHSIIVQSARIAHRTVFF